MVGAVPALPSGLGEAPRFDLPRRFGGSGSAMLARFANHGRQSEDASRTTEANPARNAKQGMQTQASSINQELRAEAHANVGKASPPYILNLRYRREARLLGEDALPAFGFSSTFALSLSP
jgi:hypothetical protein